MRKYLRLECDFCSHQFQYLSDGPHDIAPEECPSCKSPADKDTVTQLPPFMNILSAKGKSRDRSYREFERASEARIELAANESGLDKSDLAWMKITDMKDDVRQGELAIKTPTLNNPVTQAMDQMKARGQSVGFVNPMQAGIPQGSGGNAMVTGAHDKIRGLHQAESRRVASANQLGKHSS